MSRFAKQFIYGIFYLSLLIGIIFICYLLFLKPAPTCFDNKQNGNETDIDCGGSCLSCSLKRVNPLFVKELQVFPSSAGNTLLIKLTNPNINFGVSNFIYNLKTSDGTTIKSDISYIYPGETKTLSFPALAYSVESLKSSSFIIKETSWVERDVFTEPKIQYRDVNFKKENNQLIVSGVLINAESADLSNINIVSIFKNTKGETIGSSLSVIDNLLPLGTANFSIFYPSSDSVNIDEAKTEIIVTALRSGVKGVIYEAKPKISD